MAGERRASQDFIDRVWYDYFTTGTISEPIGQPWYRSRKFLWIYKHLPDNPRCRLCYFPFKGLGGTLVRGFFGVVPSRLNPQICNECEQFAETFRGGAELELTILFADVRGSTQLAETMNPTDFGRLINRFYNTATKELFQANAMVEKLIGDAVTGFFTPGFSGPNHARVALDTASAILRATGHQQPGGPWISVGIGVHTGLAYLGAVDAAGGGTDIAVLGDTANLGARLASLAGPGEIYFSQATGEAAGVDPSACQVRKQDIKGRSEPVEVWVMAG
jgi:adenylate cyclase